MESVTFDRQRGQILVQVALMTVALFAFVALALDGGQIYGGRRRMQNAADAGALAGAQELCFGEEQTAEAAEAAAREYAEDRNGAQVADVEIVHGVGYTVTVVATQTLDTFFAGVIGINTADVQARAAAVCGPQVVGPAWPLAFDLDTWENDVGCGDTFVVWDFDYDEMDEMCIEDDQTADCNPDDCGDAGICEKYDCDIYGPVMGTGNWNWLALPDDFPDIYSSPCTGQPTGASWLKCWLLNKYPPVLEEGQCVWTEPGAVSAAENPVTEIVTNEDPDDDYRNIILWDEWCTEDDGTGRSEIRISSFGCIEILDYHGPAKGDRLELCPCDAQKSSDCDYITAITAKRICEGETGWDACHSPGGVGGGAESDAWAVSLVE